MSKFPSEWEKEFGLNVRVTITAGADEDGDENCGRSVREREKGWEKIALENCSTKRHQLLPLGPCLKARETRFTAPRIRVQWKRASSRRRRFMRQKQTRESNERNNDVDERETIYAHAEERNTHNTYVSGNYFCRRVPAAILRHRERGN